MMTRRIVRATKMATVVLGAGMLFGGVSCVADATQAVGTGITLTAASGVLGTSAQPATAVGGTLNLISGLLRLF